MLLLERLLLEDWRFGGSLCYAMLCYSSPSSPSIPPPSAPLPTPPIPPKPLFRFKFPIRDFLLFPPPFSQVWIRVRVRRFFLDYTNQAPEGKSRGGTGDFRGLSREWEMVALSSFSPSLPVIIFPLFLFFFFLFFFFVFHIPMYNPDSSAPPPTYLYP